jgi:hypothetical protein
MKLIEIKRKLMLYQNIYAFNTLQLEYFVPSKEFNDNFDSMYDLMLDDIKDNYLKLASLPLNDLYFVLDYAIIILIIQTKSYLISGKLMRLINKYFSNRLIKKARKKNMSINSQPNGEHLLKLINIIENNSENFFLYLRYKFALDVFDTNCHEAIRRRIVHRFDISVFNNDAIIIDDIFGLYSLQMKKISLFYAANILFPNYFK